MTKDALPESLPDFDSYGRARTPYAIHCIDCGLEEIKGCGLVYLTKEEYTSQLMKANRTWRCPICGMYDAKWDDENYSEMTE